MARAVDSYPEGPGDTEQTRAADSCSAGAEASTDPAGAAARKDPAGAEVYNSTAGAEASKGMGDVQVQPNPPGTGTPAPSDGTTHQDVEGMEFPPPPPLWRQETKQKEDP